MSGVMICPDCLCEQHSEDWKDNQMVVGVPGMPNQFVSLPVSHPVISCNECPTKWTDWRHEDISEAIQNAFNRGYTYGKGREVEN